MTTKRNRDGHTITAVTPPPSDRLAASLTEQPYDLRDNLEQTIPRRNTVLYLAYGSNLSNETFLGRRGIKPLSQINVQVPRLRLTFDLPGMPYIEPCFANTGLRDPDSDTPPQTIAENVDDEKRPLLSEVVKRKEYHKDRWHKGLIGVVYEVTPDDYAHIIATEGGGSSYQDILVDCYPLPIGNPEVPVPQHPILPPFKAHTLFAPAVSPGQPPPKDGGRFQRPDPSYAQPSARYLKLMTDGASERVLPYEYQDYLHSLRPYTITTARQRVGQFIFLTLWGPLLLSVFGLGKVFADEDGKLPEWLRELSSVFFKAVWASYDSVFKSTFGDGERSVKDDDDDQMNDGTRYAKSPLQSLGSDNKMLSPGSNPEKEHPAAHLV